MNKFVSVRLYSLLILGFMISFIACDDNGDEPEPDFTPVRLDIEVVRGSVEDIEGNVYETVIIGDQEWMAENLRTTAYNNGEPIDFPGGNDELWVTNTTGAYSWYNNAESNADLYGAVYNWYAVNTNNLCPDGWRVPNNNEWTQLVDHLIVEHSLTNSKGDIGGVGNRLKSCRQVRSPLGSGCNTSVNPRWDSHDKHYGFDDFGFAGLPIGSRGSNGTYIANAGFFGQWWSSTSNNDNEAFNQYLTYDNGSLFRASSPKTGGYAIRCIK